MKAPSSSVGSSSVGSSRVGSSRVGSSLAGSSWMGSLFVAFATIIGAGSFSSALANPSPLATLTTKPTASLSVRSEALLGNEKVAKQQLDAAKALRRAASKKSGEERRSSMLSAAEAYRKVVTDNPDQSRLCAEAAFRAGEIERSLGDLAKARGAFEIAVNHGKEAPQFGARAMSEMAHIDRRNEKLDEALVLYRKVAETFPGQDAEGARAITWAGKVEAKLGKSEEARKTWLSIGDRFSAQPILAIRAADLAALSFLEDGDVANARKTLDDVESRFGEDNKNQPWWTPQVDETLAKMRIHAKLAGNAASNDAGDTAEEEEEDGADRR